MTSQALVLVTASLDGQSLGTWRTSGDFTVEGDSTKYLQSDGTYADSPGFARLGTLELGRVFDTEVEDFWAFVLRRVKRGKVTVTRTLLDDEFTATTRARRYAGRLLSATESGTDLDGQDNRLATIVVDVLNIPS